MCGSEEGSYFRFVYHSTPGLRFIKKKKKFGGLAMRVSGVGWEGFSLLHTRSAVEPSGKTLQSFQGPFPETQGQNLALIV